MTLLPLHFDSVLHTFGSPIAITVYDTLGAYEFGQWQESALQKRPNPIHAIILATPSLTLDARKEGSSAHGGITLYTQELLHFTDVCRMNESIESRQSYVEYQNLLFRVMGTGVMHANVGMHQYSCTRFIP